MTAKKIALFIDADNISAKFGKKIIETLENRGEIFIRRIYGNWEKSSLHGWNECILNFSLRAVQQTDYAAGKNATDLSLAIDAMDILYGGRAEIFALVSNDSDFTPLAIRLREGGMKIIGMGNAQASNSFRMACDEFIDLESLENIKTSQEQEEKEIVFKPAPAQILPKVSSPLQAQSVEKITAPVVTNPKVISISDRKLQSERDKFARNERLKQLHGILQETAKTYDDANGFVNLSRVSNAINKKNLGFELKNVGYSSLRKFVSNFPRLYEVQVSDNIVRYRCVTTTLKNSVDKIQQIHDVLHEAAKILGDEKVFVDLSRAGDYLSKKNLSIKGSGYSSLSKFISTFPKLYELNKCSYRCR